MSVASPDFGDLDINLARALTDAVAPEEGRFFDELVAASRAPPSKAKDHTLGFGVSAGEIGAASIVLFELAKPLLLFMWDIAKDAAGKLIKDNTADAMVVFQRKVRSWIGMKLKGPPPVTIPPDKLAELVILIEQRAVSLNLNPAAVEKLSGALQAAFGSR